MILLRALWSLGLLAGLVLSGAYLYIQPSLPSVEELRDVQLQMPMRVLSTDGNLVAVYGTKHRIPVTLEQTPLHLRRAFIAAEDARFYEHPGVDVHALARAFVDLIDTGVIRQGGSTITMQLARNFYLTRERRFVRKAREIFLALRLEQEFEKDEILELYMNKIFLGHRAYGVAAASETYYGILPSELSLAQAATIAGLPKAPSALNPISNPKAARIRRRYVLTRMRDEGFISAEQFQEAVESPLSAKKAFRIVSSAPYFTEMVRAEMVERYGQEAYTSGFVVHTTLREDLQEVAIGSLRRGLVRHDLRHGYRGAVRQVSPLPESARELEEILAETPKQGGFVNGIVTHAGEQSAYLYLEGKRWAEVPLSELGWARQVFDIDHYGPPPRTTSEVLASGDVVRLTRGEDDIWRLRQIPQAEGALVALDPGTGAVRALVGGFDFSASKFNRASQALRQPGSGFKPFLYSAALEYGYTPSTIINDSPLVYPDQSLEGVWRPKNYSGQFHGPTRMRFALTRSLNVVSVRILRDIGIPYVRNYVHRFGFDTERLSRNLTLALGTGEVTPLEVASAFAIFANDGYRIEPYWIERIVNHDGTVAYQASPRVACGADCQAGTDDDWLLEESLAPRVLDRRVRYQIASMLHNTVTEGTARGALVLGRSDLAGKTGTTNSLRDAWFTGFHPDLVTAVWVGRDDNESLGSKETGSRTALPIWIDFMREALEGMPEKPLEMPPGIVVADIDPASGFLAHPENPGAIAETYRQEFVPTRQQLPERKKGTLLHDTPEQSVF